MIHQLEMRRGAHIVVTSDLPTRNDGLPYANARCEDPGIAVWWIEHGKEQVMACDRWSTIGYNMRAIDLSLKALRGLDRWGASDMVERAFAGFAALPPGASVETKPQWYEIFNVEDLYSLVNAGTLGKRDLLAIVKTRHRDAIASAHPDRGGTIEQAAELNAALDEAEKILQA